MIKKFLKSNNSKEAEIESPAKTEVEVSAKPALPAELELTKKELLAALSDFHLREYAEEILDTVFDIAWEYPASARIHHTQKHGLLQHTLAVAVKVIENLPEVFPPADLPPGEKLKSWLEKVKLHALIAALCHDLGKVMEWTVDTKGYNFNPVRDNLRTFGRDYTLKNKLENVNYDQTPIFSVMLMQEVLKRSTKFLYSQYYDVVHLLEASNAVLMHHCQGMQDNRYWKLLKDADETDTIADKESFLEQTTVDTQPSEEKNVETSAAMSDITLFSRDINTGSVAIVRKTIDAMRELTKNHFSYGRHYFLTENDWLLIVNPLCVNNKRSDELSLIPLLEKMTGRTIEEPKLYKKLIDANLMIKLNDDTDFYNLQLVSTNGKDFKKLSFLILDATQILTQTELKGRNRYKITNLESFEQKEAGEGEEPEAEQEKKIIDISQAFSFTDITE